VARRISIEWLGAAIPEPFGSPDSVCPGVSCLWSPYQTNRQKRTISIGRPGYRPLVRTTLIDQSAPMPCSVSPHRRDEVEVFAQ
jgi:hypothetical protein